MKVLMIARGRAFLKNESTQKRIVAYGQGVDELHVVLFSLKSFGSRNNFKLSENVWIYPTYSISRFLYVLDAWRKSKTIGNVDLVTAQDPFDAGMAGAIISKAKKAAFECQVHVDVFSPRFGVSVVEKLQKKVAKYVFKRATCIRAVSRRVGERVRNEVAGAENKIEILPIRPDINLHNNYRSTNNSEQIKLLAVSRLEKEKNIELAVKTLALFKKEFPKASLTIVGDGSQEDFLQSLAFSLGVFDSISFEGWQKDVFKYYLDSDVLLVTSWYEGYGRTFIESALASLPIVSTDVGIVGEVFKANKEILVADYTPESFVSKVKEIVTEPEKCKMLVSNAKKAVINSMGNPDDYSKSITDLWRKCVSRYSLNEQLPK
jgi:glycosyltransferase involved in cell wall biosynthesis